MVCSPRSSITAISLLVLPSATSRSTCNSRGESDSSGLRSRLSRSPRWMRASSRSETCGLRYEPPRATVRKASSKSAEEAFFRTKARAPLRMALTTEFSSSYIERMTTLAFGQWQQFGGGLDAVHAGQADVHQDQVGIGLLAELHGVGAVIGFAHHAELGAALQDGLDAIADQFVVIDKNNVENHISQ